MENVEQPDRFRKVKDLVQNVKTNETVKQVKLHLTKNKKTYIVGAIGVIAYASKSRPFKIVISNNNKIAPVIAPVFNNAVNNGGYMRKIVRCLETDEMWPSISQAADYAGVSISKMSKHLNGHGKDHVNDLHYVIEGLAAG